MKNKVLNQQYGFNLLEILIAVLVLSVGLLGLAGLQVSSLKATQNAATKQQVAFALNELLERVRNNPQGLDSYLDETPLQGVAFCDQLPPTCDAAQCSSNDMAVYDLYHVWCGAPARGNALRSGLGYLPQSSLQIECAGANCDPENNIGPIAVNLTVAWADRSVVDTSAQDDSAGSADDGSDPQRLVLSVILSNPPVGSE